MKKAVFKKSKPDFFKWEVKILKKGERGFFRVSLILNVSSSNIAILPARLSLA